MYRNIFRNIYPFCAWERDIIIMCQRAIIIKQLFWRRSKCFQNYVSCHSIFSNSYILFKRYIITFNVHSLEIIYTLLLSISAFRSRFTEYIITKTKYPIYALTLIRKVMRSLYSSEIYFFICDLVFTGLVLKLIHTKFRRNFEVENTS